MTYIYFDSLQFCSFFLTGPIFPAPSFFFSLEDQDVQNQAEVTDRNLTSV